MRSSVYLWQREINAELSDAPAARASYIWLRMGYEDGREPVSLVSYITLAASSARPLFSCQNSH